MASPSLEAGVYAVPDDGNEDSCGACQGIGVLICCENCPAAFHATCAGYKDEDDIPGGEDDPWLCWSCCRDTKTPFAHTQSPSGAQVGDWVMLAVREGAVTYHKAKVTAVSNGAVTVRHNDLKGSLEEVPLASSRLWHGTLEDKAWEKRHSSYMPVSRAYGIDTDLVHGSTGTNGVSSIVPDVQCAGGGTALAKSGDKKRKAPAESEQPKKAPKLTVKLPASSAPAARSGLSAKGLGAGLPLHRGPSLPARPVSSIPKHAAASRAGRAAAQSQQDGLAGNKPGSSPLSIVRPAGTPSGFHATSASEGASSAKPRPGGVSRSAAGCWSGEIPCREKFTSAHISWLRAQGDTGERARQYFEDAEIDVFLLWTHVAQHGGMDRVGARMAWNEIGKSVGLPDTLVDKQSVCRRRFKAARLEEFTEACRAGLTGIKLPIPFPPRTPQASSNVALATPRQCPAANPQPQQQMQQQSARPKVSLRQKPKESSSSAPAGDKPGPAQSLPEPKPSARSADLRVVGWTEVVSPHTLKPGVEVEVRPIDGPYLGGWHQATILETAPGSMWEGGLRVHVELQENNSSSGPAEGPRPRRWLPLVHAPANSVEPAVVVRLPPKLAHLPQRWALGECVEGLWAEEESWWPACVHAVLPKGYLELRVEPTAMHPEGEIWEVHSSLVRSAPTAGPLQQVLLHEVQECARVLPESLRHRMAWQQHFVEEDWVLESYATEASMPRTPEHQSLLSARLSSSGRQPVANSLEECLTLAAQRASKGPILGGTPKVGAVASTQRSARLADLARRSSLSADAAAMGADCGTPASRSSPHTSAPPADSSTGVDAASVQPSGSAHPAALRSPLPAPAPPQIHPAPSPTPRPALPGMRTQQSPPTSRSGSHLGLVQRDSVAAHRTLSPLPRATLAEMSRPPVVKLIPMAGRTGKLNPVKSCIGSPAEQQAPGPPTPPRKHVWPSKNAAHGIARPDMSPGTTSLEPVCVDLSGRDSMERSAGGGSHVNRIRKALAPHNRSELFKKPLSRTSAAPISLPPLGPRFGVGRVEHFQKAGAQTPPIYPRINFSIGLGPPPGQKPQPAPHVPVSNAAPQQPDPPPVQRPAVVSKLVAALQFSPHFRAAPQP